jgi:hypothetical protein
VLLPNLDQINEAYLQGLCDDKTTESQTLEFKRELPATDEKRELQKDVCALANADGGDIVYGIAEVAGSASKVMPLPTAFLDAARRRIAQALNSIEPRLQGLRVHPVQVTDGFAVIARVPASFDGPHSYRVDSGARKFVMRNGTDTTDMNFDQIRTAFDRTATLAEQAREFIDKRFAAISQRQTWRPFVVGPICAVALVPIAGLAGRLSVDIAALNNSYSGFTFRDWSSVSRTMNLDGLVVYPVGNDGDGVLGYTQIYRNGAVVALRTGAALAFQKKIIPSSMVTGFYRDAIMKAIYGAKALGFTGPAVLKCAMVSVTGYQFGVGRSSDPRARAVAHPDRDSLVLPDTWVSAIEGIETSDQIDALTLPMMDMLWQAFDLERCLEFDVLGKWAPRTQ